MNLQRTRATPDSEDRTQAAESTIGLRIEIQGAVQGVGFRPFVYRIATELEIFGSVINDSRGVEIEIEGPSPRIQCFRDRLQNELPPQARILDMVQTEITPKGLNEFRILASDDSGLKTAVMLPEIATCAECLSEVADPNNRRYRYPFTNCTHCGPRFTIIEDLPYDRPNTTMRRFDMCTSCSDEYQNPRDRRYHAQPNACPECGPRVVVLERDGSLRAEGDEALRLASQALRNREIVAVKGLGGFHLMVDARSEEAVQRLRSRKMRYQKPLAVMVRHAEEATEICKADSAELELLTSSEAPIVLLRHRSGSPIASVVAPDNPRLGVMMPYSPLHRLLLDQLDFPVVATSGNLSDEPICTDNFEALDRLDAIADLFLAHDRPIARHCDDSVMQVVDGRTQPIRRARGLAPLPIVLESRVPEILAVGGHLKNVVALSKGDKAFLSQHIGDMETVEARDAFEAVVADFLKMYDAVPVAVAHDLHPDYPTTHWAGANHTQLTSAAESSEASLVGVQHHHAHLASCLADNGISKRCLGVVWDGTGFGNDGSIWGGEFLLGDAAGFDRRARLRPFSLPGGDAAVRSPNRSAVAVLWEILGDQVFYREELLPIRSFSESEKGLISGMLGRRINCPRTTSAGRLFDAAAALLGIRQHVDFEGQAAMMLEFVARPDETGHYPFALRTPSPMNNRDSSEDLMEIDWEPIFVAMLDDLGSGIAVDRIAARFQNTLIAAIEAVAVSIAHPTVALTGGCFQNRFLAEQTARTLRARGFEVLTHHQVPCNDGGLSLGQIAVAAAQIERAGT